MKKLLSFVIMLSMCIAPFNGNIFVGIKTQALNIPIKTSYTSFSSKERVRIDNVSSISYNSPVAKATYINGIKDAELYEYCLKETLDTYYGDIKTYGSQLDSFKKNISSGADEIIKNYEVAAEERITGEKNGYSPTEVLVSFEPGTSIETIETIGENLGSGYDVLFSGVFEPHDDISERRKKYLNRRIDHGAIVSINVDLDKTTAKTIEEINSLDCVKSSSLNAILTNEDATTTSLTNDVHIAKQYYLNNINIEDAWGAIGYSHVFCGPIVVAVLDTGLDVDHEDVTGKFFSTKSVDITKEGNPKLKNLTNPYTNYHGTAVWGVIKANSNNGKGITGMYAQDKDDYGNLIRVMAVKMRKDGANGTPISNYVKAINYAVSAGAEVINISSGFYEGSSNLTELHSAIKNAYSEGVTIVSTAGNDGINTYRYPGCYDEVIGVAATDINNQMCSWSNNNDKIDICAPGSSIYALTTDNNYQYVSGTSVSAPMVAATVALMEIFHDLSPNGAKNVIQKTEAVLTDTNALEHGLLNTGRAVEYSRYLDLRDYPITFRSVVLSNSKPKLRWDGLPTNYDGFTVYRSKTKNGEYKAVKRMDFDNLLWDGDIGCYYCYDSSAESGKTYYYKIRAYVTYDKTAETPRKYGDFSKVKSITIP